LCTACIYIGQVDEFEGSPSDRPNLKENKMLNALFGKRRRNRNNYQWKPAIDLTNPRIVATLTTFPTN
jgi:hypothetical protein